MREDEEPVFFYAEETEAPQEIDLWGSLMEGREMDRTVVPRRMDVWYADLPLHSGSCVQGGSRPVVVISNDICNERNSVVTVLPMTRQMKRLELPMHVVVTSPDGEESLVLTEQIMTIDKSLLDNRLGSVSAEDMRKIESALLEQIGIGGFEE